MGIYEGLTTNEMKRIRDMHMRRMVAVYPASMSYFEACREGKVKVGEPYFAYDPKENKLVLELYEPHPEGEPIGTYDYDDYGKTWNVLCRHEYAD